MEVAERKTILRAGAMLGNYRIQGFLGQGGFGVTYLALDTKLDLQVAIKEYMPEQLAARSDDDSVEPRSPDEHKLFAWGLTRFIKEAQTLARFNHSNIVRVMAVFELNETAYMVMEYERGHDLKALIKQPGFRSETNLKRLVGPVLDGLAEVHRHGYIHRDIKPANILVRENGTPVLLDFGSARKAAPEQTQALTSLITVGYAPLEQYNSASGQEQGPWTDIYALAAVLYFAVTGKAPVESTLRGSAVLNDRPDPLVKLEELRPAGYSLSFCRAVDWGLGFKMADRPQSIDEWRPVLLNDDDEATRIAPTSGRSRQQGAHPPHSASHPGATRVSSANDRSHARDSINELRASTHPPPVVDHPGTTRVTGDLEGMEAIDTSRQQSMRSAGTPSRRLLTGRPAQLDRPVDQPQQSRRPATTPARSGRRAGLLLLLVPVVAAALVFGYLTWNDQWQSTEEIATGQGSDRGSADEQADAEAAAQAREREAARAAEAARVQAEAEAAARARAQEAARAAEAARVQAEAEAAARAREQEAARAAEAARVQAEAEAAARAREQAAAELRARQEAEAAREAAAREAARQAAEAAAAAQRRAEAESATELPEPDPTRAISEQDMYLVQSRFSALVNAIESRDMAEVERLAFASERVQAYLRYLFGNFEQIDAAMVNIRASRLRQTISGTLQIRHMIRSNGDRVFPPEQFRNNAVHSTRLQDWSKIHW